MNKENKEPIFEFDFNLIADFFRALDRQGPGGDEQTLRALEFLPATVPDSASPTSAAARDGRPKCSPGTSTARSRP